MRTLEFDQNVFEKGNGWIYRKIMSVTLPGLILAALEMALINAGVLQMQSIPEAALKALGILTVIYIIPSVFIFPTVWFLSSGRTRLYKRSRIDLYKKKLVYHQVVSLTMSKPRYTVYSVTQLRKVEKKRGTYVLHGAVTNETSGGSGTELKIPAAFADMDLISEMARYR